MLHLDQAATKQDTAAALYCSIAEHIENFSGQSAANMIHKEFHTKICNFNLGHTPAMHCNTLA